MKLSKDELALLRSLVEWRRVNGWSRRLVREEPFRDYNGAPMSPEFERHHWERDGAFVDAIVEEGVLWGVNYQPDDSDDTMLHMRGGLIRQVGLSLVVDALVAAHVLPAPFSFGRPWGTAHSREEADEDLAECRKYYPAAWMEHRRAGETDWSKVDA